MENSRAGWISQLIELASEQGRRWAALQKAWDLPFPVAPVRMIFDMMGDVR